MPALPNAADCFKAEILGNIDTIPYANVLHFKKTSAIVAGDAATMATALKNAWVTNMIPQQNGNFTLGSVRVTDLTSLTGEQASATSGAVGTKSGTMAPASACQVITVLSATRSRSGRGRVFISGLDGNSLFDARNWSSGYTTSVSTAFAAVVAAGVAALGAASSQFGVLSYYSGVNTTTKKPILRGTPVFFPFTSLRINQQIETQRRRLGRA